MNAAKEVPLLCLNAEFNQLWRSKIKSVIDADEESFLIELSNVSF